RLIGPDPLVQAIDYAAQQKHVLVVLAAGNNSLPAADYVDVDSEALVAGAIGRQGEVAFYSNSGEGVNIYAPGGDDMSGSGSVSSEIVSTYIARNGHENQYAVEQGTSFAPPYAAGGAALHISRGYAPRRPRPAR